MSCHHNHDSTISDPATTLDGHSSGCNSDPATTLDRHGVLNTILDVGVALPRGLFINAIQKSCNIVSVNGEASSTVNSIDQVTDSEHCFLYCAHEKCGAALDFYHKHTSGLNKRCKNIHYLKGGVKQMKLHPKKFSFQGKC